jgi:1,2-diacylglycerol 3-alpha-glucosyltransferase
VKVAVIFHRFGPYHCARLRAASHRFEVVGIELGAESHDYDWTRVEGITDFQRVTLFPDSDGRLSPVKVLEERMRAALSASAPNVISIPGWSDKGALLALQWCAENKAPAVLMSESTATDERRVWWKESVKRRIVALCSSALVGGERHKEYLTDLGMPREQIFLGYDAVDNDYFAQRAKEVRGPRFVTANPSAGGSGIRRNYGLPENYFLASARFIPKKNLDALIREYAKYRERSEIEGQRLEPWSLVLLGDGPLKADLQYLISELGLQNFVLLPGFKQYGELPVYYALANAFVHASSSEQWGLVVNEAMASGLPVIVSESCGCAPELVQEGINGFTFDPSDQTQLASRLLKMSALSLREREKMGRASHEIVQRFDAEEFGQGLENAANFGLSHARKPLGLIDRLVLNRVLSR